MGNDDKDVKEKKGQDSGHDGEHGGGSDNKTTTIIVNQREHKVSGDTITVPELQRLASAPGDYEVWQIIRNPDPEGQLPKDDVRVTGTIKIKNGDRFRVVPPGTFGSSVPDEILRQVETLKQSGDFVTVAHGGDGFYHVTITGRLLPSGYNKQTVNRLVRLPASYPQGNPDMFWVDHDLRLAGGGMPQNSSVEQVEGKPWLRFSWHPSKWNPGVDDLATYLEFVERRLVQVR